MNVRRLLALATLVGAAVAPATAAFASGGASVSAPSSVTTRDDVHLGGSVSSSQGGTLTFGPAGGTTVTADSRATAGDLGCSVTAAGGGCGLGPLRNGDYTLTVTSRPYTTSYACGPANTQTCTDTHPAVTSQQTVTFRVPPAAPGGVTAQANGRVVTVSWSANTEPDLLRYALYSGSTQLETVPLSGCSSGSCAATVDYRGSTASGEQTYTVRALRNDGTGSALMSAASGPATAALAPPPTAAPPASSGGSGGTAGGDSASASGSSTGAGRGSSGAGGTASGGTTAGGGPRTTAGGGSVPADAAASGAGGRPTFGVSVGSLPGSGVRLPILPAQGAGAQPALPGGGREEPGPLGTYKPTLPYQDRVALERYGVKGTATRFVQSVVSFTTDGHQLVRSLAGALALVLVGLHLRVLTRTSRYE